MSTNLKTMANALREVLTEFDITTVKTRGKTNKISADEGTVEQIAACLKELTISSRKGNDEILVKLTAIQENTAHLEKAITDTQLEVEDCKQQMHDLRSELREVKDKLKCLEHSESSTADRLDRVEDQCDLQDHTLRRCQVLIEGIPE